MTRHKSFGLQNNLPLLLALLVVVFVIPLNVFAVTFQKLFLNASASTPVTNTPNTLNSKVSKTFLGKVLKIRQDKFVLSVASGEKLTLVKTPSGPKSFEPYVGREVVISGWNDQSNIYVQSLTYLAR